MGMSEEDRKRGVYQAREREAKIRKFRKWEEESDDEEDDETMVGDFEVNLGSAECGNGDAFRRLPA